MERLVNYILENIVFVVIILGVITSLLSKKKAGPAQPGMPTFGNDGHRPSPTVESKELAPRHVQTRTPRVEEPAPMRTKKQPPQRTNHQSNLAQKREERRRSAPSTTQRISDQTSPIYQSLQSGDRQAQAMQGMAWSEIFGPPRAFKRHSRR